MIRICIPCGYIYTAEQAFDSLPDSWCCPDCGANRKSFALLDESLPEKKEDSNEE